MGLDRQLWRLMAAMIAMIVVYASPSAVKAHEGHAHRAPHHALSEEARPTLPVAVKATVGNRSSSVPASLQGLARPVLVDLQASAVESVASPRMAGNGAEKCPGAGNGSCCGKNGCCTPGILSGQAELRTIPFRQALHIPGDIAGSSGAGPGALPEPPRTLA